MTEPDLYGLSLADVSRQVDRHWEVSQFFILLNMSVVGGAIALIGLSGSRLALVLGMIAFLGGIGLSAAGVAAGWQAKKYYRVAIAKKTLLEAELGLTG